MLADAHITDTINIPVPCRNSYSHAGVPFGVLSRNGHPLICLTCVCQLPEVEVSSPLQSVLLQIVSFHTFIWYQRGLNDLGMKLLSIYPPHPDTSLDLSFVG